MSASRAADAAADLFGALRQGTLWWMLGWQDIRSRYRRTSLGPIWIMMTTALSIAGLGAVYGVLFQAKLTEFFPFVAAGIVVWTLFSAIILEGAAVFYLNVNIVRNVRMPLFVLILRLLVRNFIVFGHNLVVLAVVLVVFRVTLSWWTLAAVPALAVVLLNGAWVALVLGTAGARFRDVPEIAAALLSPLFLMTPVIWKPADLQRFQFIALVNPFAHFIEIVRAPLLGHPPPGISVLVTILITVIGWSAAFAFYARYRRLIPLWV
jgi:lipopolysaccharide transport system permease protein